MADTPATSSVRCTCRPSRGLACTRCYAPHYAAGLDALPRPALIDPATVSAQLVAMLEPDLRTFEGKGHE